MSTWLRENERYRMLPSMPHQDISRKQFDMSGTQDQSQSEILSGCKLALEMSSTPGFTFKTCWDRPPPSPLSLCSLSTVRHAAGSTGVCEFGQPTILYTNINYTIPTNRSPEQSIPTQCTPTKHCWFLTCQQTTPLTNELLPGDCLLTKASRTLLPLLVNATVLQRLFLSGVRQMTIQDLCC